MCSLHEVQARLATAIISDDPQPAAALIRDDAPGAAARLAVYANHYRITLTDALAATFSVVRQLVGEVFFRGAARRYITLDPPRSPCLTEYGSGFAAFLRGMPEAASLPYLSGVARLEWAIHRASHAIDWPEGGSGTAATSEPVSTEMLAVHPSCRLITSAFPIDRIWQAHQCASGSCEPIDLNSGSVRLLVGRMDGTDEATPGCIALPEAEAVLIASLITHGRLRPALNCARAIAAAFDPTPLLAALIEADLIRPAGTPYPHSTAHLQLKERSR